MIISSQEYGAINGAVGLDGLFVRQHVVRDDSGNIVDTFFLESYWYAKTGDFQQNQGLIIAAINT